ncbi:MAG: hypothetical protein HFJ54_07380 [Clostridia bacterium]|nr:hypothetical protein [Clostridia bacterium]
MVTNDLEECIFSIPSPFDEDNGIDLYLTLDDKCSNDVKIINGSPYISCDVKLNARILSANKNSNYFEEENLELIESYANSYIKSQIEAYLYKTSKDYKSDIAVFGKHAVKYFSTWDEWLEYNWLDNYSNSFFNVNVDVNVISSYLIS